MAGNSRQEQTASNGDVTPDESDDALEPVDVLAVDRGRLLFYLASRVPVSIGNLGEGTIQSAPTLRQHFYKNLQNEIDIDSTGFVRLTAAAREPVIDVVKPYIRSGQSEFDAGKSAMEADLYGSALERFERALEFFEQVRSRLASVNYQSEKLDQRVEATRSHVERANSAIGDSENQVQAMLETVRDLYTDLGRVPKTSELPKDCDYSPNQFYDEFGSWDEALKAAGIDKERDLLDDFERVAAELGHPPKSGDMDEHGVYSGSTYSTYFGSFSEALERSDVDDNREQHCLETLRSLNERLERPPKISDLHDVSGVTQHDFIQIFGGWDEALKAAGIDKEQFLIEEVKEVAEKVGRLPKPTDFNRFGSYTSTTYRNQFGSWDELLEAAGLESQGTATTQNSEGQKNAEAAGASTPIEDISPYIKGVGPQSVLALKRAGYTTLGVLANADPEEITNFEGIGPTKADELIKFAVESVSETQSRSKTTSEKSKSGDGLHPETPIEDIELRVEGVGRSSINAVKKAGYETVGDLDNARPEDVTEYKGIGPTKARRVIRFAEENVSSGGEENSPSRSSLTPPERGSPSPSTPGLTSNQVEPTALDSSWETIPQNERVDGQFLILVTGVDRQAGERTTGRLSVRDQNGREFEMDIWSKHGVVEDWSVGEWYAVENARGKVWVSKGETRKRLSSTKDLDVVKLGADFDPSSVSIGAGRNAESPSRQPGSLPRGRDANEPTDPPNASRSETEEREPDTDTESDDEVLDEIMSDFDGL